MFFKILKADASDSGQTVIIENNAAKPVEAGTRKVNAETCARNVQFTIN